MSDNIKVVVKVRPLISREIEEKLPHQWRVYNNTLYQIDSNRRDCGQIFTFDKVYDEDTKTSDVYNDIAKPIVEAATAGINGTIFAYGQTSSGKTYTMTGTDDSPGIIQLAVLDLFDIIKKVPNRDFLVRVSYIELYNETLKDLLDIERQKEVKIQEDYDGNVKVLAKEMVTSTPEEVLEAMKYGNKNRHTGATNMNEKSSRSHSIFQITIESREHIEGAEQATCVNVSQLNLVDLAGSERAGQTGATGQRFKEGTLINKSLSALALVIKQLSEDPNRHANYRDNKLTRILQNSLGGNAKTSIICAITPAALEETVSTLQFATRAKTIKNKPEVNEVSNDATMIQKLTKELAQLQAKLKGKEQLEVILENKKHLEQNLKNRIQNLQKLILNGFDQRSNVEMMGGCRKKLQQPRRVTIHSTLHNMEDEEESALSIPKFRTPILKYNSMLLPNTSDFVPITNKLTTLPEEPVTPPKGKNVCFNDEVIELDSDDEVTATNVTCSPYHIKCRDTSKTPPCVLREIANEAERKCKEIVEFTEREKIYQPDVVELMEQIEKSNAAKNKLFDEIEVLKKTSEEKINELDLLKTELTKAKDEISSLTSLKAKLESQCQEYQTKLTDFEVSYETLQRKTKSREEELLSLLNEQKKHKVVEDISKIPIKPREYNINFMDMSKDISLVNSEYETSITSQDGSVSPVKTPEVGLDLQTQLNAKNQIILDLETEMSALNCRLNSLEKTNNELLLTLDNCKTNIGCIEKEKSMLKSAVDALNSTLQSKEDTLESNKILIQELQTKLTEKENILCNRVSDTDLEAMLMKEAKVIANNENFANIIYSFKSVVEKRNEQINELKHSLQNTCEDKNKLYLELIEKTNDIVKLNNELSDLKEQLTFNTDQVNRLLREKDLSEQRFNEKLSDVESQKALLDKIVLNLNDQIENLTDNRDQLKVSLNEKIKNEESHFGVIKELENKVKDMTTKLTQLEETVIIKQSTIESLTKNNDVCNKHIEELENKIKEMTVKLTQLEEIISNKQSTIESLTKDNDVSNKHIEEMENKIKDITVKLTHLEESVSYKQSLIESLSQNNDAKNKYIEEIKQTLNKVQKVYMILTGDIREIPEILEDYFSLTKTLSEGLTALEDICSNIVGEKENANKTIALLKQEYLDLKDQHKEEVSLLREEMIKLEKTIQDCTIENNNLKATNSKLNEDLVSNQTLFKDGYTKSQFEVEIMSNKVTLLEEQLKCKILEISDIENKLVETERLKDLLTESIAAKLSILMNRLHFESDFSFDEISGDSHEQDVLLIFDKIVKHVITNNFVIEETSITNILKEEQKEKDLVVNQNMELTNKLSQVENENQELLNKQETIQRDCEITKTDLDKSENLLRDLKEELKVKSDEITKMECKVKEWKEEFENLDKIMKQQSQYLVNENDKLKDRLLTLKEDTETQINRLNNETNEFDEENTSIKLSRVANNKVEIKSPPSLLTICCNTITDTLELRDDTNSHSSSSNTKIQRAESTLNCIECEKLNLELFITKEENCKILEILEQLEVTNKELLEEREEVRKELQLFIEPAQELQKKILNHKTNLSILTATTFAENASLKSQVIGMKHQDKRIQNLCQRDIPEFKKSLCDLMAILKDDSAVSENYSATDHKLPTRVNANSTVQTLDESTFDGDMLMLDTNVTLKTVDNTLVGFDFTQTTLNDNETSILNNQLEVTKTEIEEISQIRKQGTNKSLETLTRELATLRDEKKSLEIKYNEALSELKCKETKQKMDKDYNDKIMEIIKLDNMLRKQSLEINQLRVENETLSTQIMENISEIDDLSKELDKVKAQNNELRAKCLVIDSDTQTKSYPKSCLKDLILEQHDNLESHLKLSRSMSDSESSSTINKICTLQTELHAGQEDCKVLTEHVAILKDHLNCSSMSMDLDESMRDVNIKPPESKKSNVADVDEDMYKIEKINCYKYYLEITGAENKSDVDEMKIIDIMKLFYNNLIAKHNNNVENLVNKLRDYKDTQNKLETQIKNLMMESAQINSEVEQKVKTLDSVTDLFTKVKSNIEIANNILKTDNCENAKIVLEEQFLGLLDCKLNTNSVEIFRSILEKYQHQCSTLQTQIQSKSAELKLVNENLFNVKNQLLEKENEFNLVKAQKERINEISNAVTLDLIEREKAINEHIKSSYKKLIQLNIIGCGDNFNFSDAINKNLDLFVDHIIKECKLRNNTQEKEILEIEIYNLKSMLEVKEKLLNELKVQNNKLEDINNNISVELNERDIKIHTLKISYDELKNAYDMKIKDNTNNLNKIDSLTEEIDRLKDVIDKKESIIESLSKKTDKSEELLETIKNLEEEKIHLQSLNKMIMNEKESCIADLEKSCDTIKQNNIDMDKMTSDILDLRESLNGATEAIKKLKHDAEVLSKENTELTQQLEEKIRECNRLQINMKTHEKAAEIQSKIITRLQNSKSEDDKQISERQAKLTELTEKNTALTEQCDKLKNDVKASLEEIQLLKNAKASLELRLNEMEESGRKSRTSIDAILDSSRRRRRSIQESKRLFEEVDEHKNMEAVFGARSNKPDDLFMDMDDDHSGRSTPFTQNRGRDSLQSKTDQSDKDEDQPSRPSSVIAIATRRRRQSSHDLHRSVIRHTPSPHDLSNKIISELEILQPEQDNLNRGDVSEINRLKEQLTSCQQELEDLKEKYRELDEECETCAEYLHERDERCSRLKREKAALENIITELRSKQYSSAIEQMQSKRETANVAVNTDEDWTNLHSIVVDRMSFDAEVEKNKRLTKLIEELRFKKQDLKNTIDKMQKALDKHSTKDARELEATKEELNYCKEELKEWKMKYKALDEECETCSQYLKEREEQCRKLKEAKNALEAKIQEMLEDAHAAAHAQSVRKKRQTMHDMNRHPVAEQIDASTETTEDLSSYQEDTYRKAMDEAQARDIKRWKMMVESLNQQKVALEAQLRSMPMMPNPMYIATGSAIVQNQQITDVMKENHKLKQKVAKLVNICKKRGKSDVNRENEDPCQQA